MIDFPPGGVLEQLISRVEESGEPFTAAELAVQLDVDQSTVAELLDRLVDQGRLETKAVGSDTHIWWGPSSDGGAHRSGAPPALDDALDSAGVGIAALDTDLRLTYVNDAARRLLGLPASTVLGQDVRGIDSVSEELVAALDSALDGESSVVRESRPTADLEAVWVEYTVSPSTDDVTVVVEDVSAYRRLQQELRTEKEQFRTALQNSPIVAFRLDTDLRYTWVGNPHEDFDETSVLGKRDDELLPPEAAEIIMAPKRRVLETGEGVREEVTYELPSGEVTYDLTVEPLRDGTGDLVGITSAALDITEQKRRERQLREQNERLDRVTSVLSHDLRSPLSVAIGRQALYERDGNPEHLVAVRQAHERISDLIDDILTAARRQEEGTETTTVSLKETANEAWEQVETGSSTLVVDLDQAVQANESQLQQLFENLFRNSVEHGGRRSDDVTDRGEDAGVTVHVGTLPNGNGFYVEDDGVGFTPSPSEQDHLFEDGYSTRAGGTGLGLGIVRDVAAAHGWTVRATTADTGGARFEFAFDCEADDSV